MAVFELGGALGQSLPDLELGPWARAAPGLVAFDARSDQPESLWRVDLTDDVASQDALADGERSIARTRAALEHAPRRLDQSLADFARAARTQAPGDRGRTARRSDAPRLEADAPGALEQALPRIADLVRGRARIETRVDAALAACSITTLSGDTNLWIAPSLSLAGAALHARSVAVALNTRHAWARMLALVVAYAGRFAALHAGVAVLPLVWGLVRDVLREVRRLDAARAPLR